MIGSPPLWPKNLLENFTFDTVVDTVEKLFCAHQLAWLAKRNAHFFTEQLLCGYPSRHRLYAKCTLLVFLELITSIFLFKWWKEAFVLRIRKIVAKTLKRFHIEKRLSEAESKHEKTNIVLSLKLRRLGAVFRQKVKTTIECSKKSAEEISLVKKFHTFVRFNFLFRLKYESFDCLKNLEIFNFWPKNEFLDCLLQK